MRVGGLSGKRRSIWWSLARASVMPLNGLAARLLTKRGRKPDSTGRLVLSGVSTETKTKHLGIELVFLLSYIVLDLILNTETDPQLLYLTAGIYQEISVLWGAAPRTKQLFGSFLAP